MVEDHSGERELVPGLGYVHNPDSDAPQTMANSCLTPRIPEDREFQLIWYMDKSRLIALPGFKWSQPFDGFYVIPKCGKTISIHADAISGISYNINIRRFFLHPEPNVTPNMTLDEAVFEVKGVEEAAHLRSWFERRLKAKNVSKVDDM